MSEHPDVIWTPIVVHNCIPGYRYIVEDEFGVIIFDGVVDKPTLKVEYPKAKDAGNVKVNIRGYKSGGHDVKGFRVQEKRDGGQHA